MPGYDPKFYLFEDIYQLQCEEAMRLSANVYYKVVGKLYSSSETPKAIRMRVESIDGVEIKPPSMQWFPKSQFSELEYGMSGTDEQDSIQATEWILNEKKLLEALAQEKVAREQAPDLGDVDFMDSDLPDAPF